MALEYENRFVGFVDILGFASLITQLPSNPALHEKLYDALSHIRLFKSESNTQRRQNSIRPIIDKFEVSVFSDSIVISAMADPDVEPGEDHAAFYYDKTNRTGLSYKRVIEACGWLQVTLLGLGILTRGGISLGKTVHSGDILYGDGLLRAYQIEKSAAVYPRIVIDPRMTVPKSVMAQDMLDNDSDGLSFINPFVFHVEHSVSEAQHALGWDGHDAYLEAVGMHINDGMKQSIEVDHLAKWTWLKARHGSAVREYDSTRKTRAHWRSFDRGRWVTTPPPGLPASPLGNLPQEARAQPREAGRMP